MFTEVDTDIKGIVILLWAMAQINLLDARNDPAVAAELIRRVQMPAGEGFHYERDPRQACPHCGNDIETAGSDRWSCFVPLARRTALEAAIDADCEDQSAAYAAAAVLLMAYGKMPVQTVEVAVTQPRPGEIAHAYVIIGGVVFDPSAMNGMTRPPPSFYTTGTTVRLRICMTGAPPVLP